MRAASANLAWFAFLLLLSPRLSLYFFEHLVVLDVSFALRQTLLGLTYLLVFAIGLLAFALRCRARRVVAGAALVVVLGVQWLTASYGWARLALFASLLALVVVGVEIVRQNRPLLVELRRRNVPMAPLLLRSALLWSPLLLVALVGAWANHWLAHWADRAVYSATPIDPYCEVTTANRVVQVPCAEVAPADLAARQLEIPFADSLRSQVESRFLARSRDLLRRVGEDGAAARDLIPEMDPARVLGLNREPDPADERVRSDARARQLRRDIDRARAAVRAVRPPPLGYSIASPVIGKLMEATLNAERARRAQVVTRLERDLQRRIDELRASTAREERRSDAGRLRALQREMIRQLEKRHGIARPPSRTAPPSEQAAHVIRQLDRGERHAVAVIGSLAGTPELADRARAVLHLVRECRLPVAGAGNVAGEGTEERRFLCLEDGVDASLEVQSLGLKQSTDLSIDRWQLEQERIGMRRLRTLASAGHATAGDVAEAAGEAGGVVPDRIHLGRRECHVIKSFGNCVTNFGKARAEDAYADVYDLARDQAAQRVDQLTGEAAESADDAIVRLRAELYDAIEHGARFMKGSVARIDQAAGLLSVLMWVLLAVAMVKSFMFVLATRLFDALGAAHIGFDAPRTAQGHYSAGSAITIDKSFTEPMVTRVTLDNQDNQKVLAPWPLSAPLTRILHRCYFLFTRGSHYRHGEQPMHFSRANGQHIVKWDLAEGEEVMFSYANFFGASANVVLKRTISLRLSTILLGRLVFHSAVCTRGEGCLLLTVRGTVTEHRRTDSTPLERLIAWNRHTRFRVASSGTLKSVFLDGYTVVRERDGNEPSGLIVVEAIGDERNALAGAGRFIKTLFLPF